MKYLGTYKTINFVRLPQIALSLMKNATLCKKYSENGRNLVDGRGNERIAKKIIELIED
jgi:hypothetical protein